MEVCLSIELQDDTQFFGDIIRTELGKTSDIVR